MKKKKTEVSNLILSTIHFACIFYFLYIVSTPQVIIWLKELPLICEGTHLTCFLYSMRLAIYQMGAIFIGVSLLLNHIELRGLK